MRKFLGSVGLAVACSWVIVAAVGAENTFTLPPVGGLVLGTDQQTLIASVPSQGKLVYIDTAAEKQLKQVEVEFQPTLLAAQGKWLFAASKGTSRIFVLDADSAKVVREISLPGEPLCALGCHPATGLLYAVNLQNEVFSIDPAPGKATKTKAKGQLLVVDPSGGPFVYTGIQKAINDVLVIQDVGNEIRVSLAQANTRALMLKYKVDGPNLDLLAANDNAAINGRAMAVSSDGKQVAMAGGGGWRSKTDLRANYSIAVFETDRMQGVNGQVETRAYPGNIAFHPALKLGVAARMGNPDELVLFHATSFVKKDAFRCAGHSINHSGYLLFGGRGTKVIYCSYSATTTQDSILQIFSLPLTDQDRALLDKAYGDKSREGKGK